MKCAIIGGGIGGLTTAIALRRRGLDAHVFESAPELRAVGAGIWVPANALQVLDRLGIASHVAGAGAPLRRAEVHDERAGLLQTADIDAIVKRYGFGTVAILRARLQRILADQLPADALHLDHACVDVHQAGDHVRVRFGNGREITTDLLIAADGLRSGVRSQIFPQATLRYSGQTSYRGLASLTLPEELRGLGRETWGAGRRFGFSAVSESQVYWFAVEDAAPGGREEADVALSRLQRVFATFPAPTGELLEHTRADAVTRTDLFDLRPLPTWSRGRIVLIGDAAHATTPNLGQGGAQAVEDAWVLARCIAERGADYARAFADFEALRRAKAERVVRTSWWLGKLAHIGNPVGRRVRNALLKATPARASERQLQSLFELGY